MEKKPVFKDDPGDYVDVKQLLKAYFQYWYLFVIALAVALGLAFFYLRIATPQYRIASTILLKNEESQTNTRGHEPGELNLFSTKQNIDNELEV